MNEAIEVNFTSQLVRKSLLGRARIDSIFIAIILLVQGLENFIVWNVYGHLNSNWLLADLWILVLIAIVFLNYYFSYKRSLFVIKHMKSPLVKYRIEEDWFFSESDISFSKNAWVVFTGIHKGSDIWQLSLPCGSNVLLPVKLMNDNLKDFLSKKVSKGHQNSMQRLRLILWSAFTVYYLVTFVQWFTELSKWGQQ